MRALPDSCDLPAYLRGNRPPRIPYRWRLALQVSLPVLQRSVSPCASDELVAVSEKVPLAFFAETLPVTLKAFSEPSPEPLYVPDPRNVWSLRIFGLRMSVYVS